MRSSISYRVVELVRSHIGTPYVRASDADAARALGISRAAIYEYKAGKARMSPQAAARAVELLGDAAPEAMPLLEELMSEHARSEPEGAVWRLILNAAQAAKGKAAALFVAAILAAGTFYAPSSNQAVAADSNEHGLYNMRTRARRRTRELWSRFLRFFLWFPALPLAAGCTALGTHEEQTWQALHAVDVVQTRHIVDDPCFAEGNPVTRALIGREPSARSVIVWGVGAAALHAGVTELLLDHDHPTAARWWQYVTIGDAAATVGHNFYVGVRIGGPNKTPAGCTR